MTGQWAFYALLIAVLANVAANLAFKKLMAGRSVGGGVEVAVDLLLNPWLWVGGVAAMLLLVSYLYALRFIHVAVAYAFVTSSALVLMTLISVFWFGQTLSPWQTLGLVLLVFGLFLLMGVVPW